MKITRRLLAFLSLVLFLLAPVHALAAGPQVVVMSIDGAISPATQEYLDRGLKAAEQVDAEAVILELNTPGGDLGSMQTMVEAMRGASVPVIVYVTPRGAWAGSAGTVITLAGRAAAMAPETAIGAASPVGSGGTDLSTTEQAKVKSIMDATVRSLAASRPPAAIQLAQDTIDNAKAVSADEALKAGLVDFVATDLNDLLRQLNGFTVQMADGPRTLHTAGATTIPLPMSFIEQLLQFLIDPNIVFLLLALGVQALLIELTHPGAWVPGFIGVISLALAAYGLGILSVNWFGLVFILAAFVLFILDIKAPTHGALTVTGVASFILGALITMAGHVAAMAPEAAIGASSPVGSSGQDLNTTEQAKASQIMKATIRPLVERRGPAATQLAQDMIDKAKAVTAQEALQAHLIDFIATNTADVLRQLDGRNVAMPAGNRTLHTAGATTEAVDMSLIEQLLLILTDSNIVFILLAVGVLALQVELTHPGTWVPGFVGVICLALAIYGLGLLPVNWFGLLFMLTAFVLFILDIKAPTHGALTVAGVASFIVGGLVLFNSPGVPQFERVSVPLVVGVGVAIGLLFATILGFALRSQRQPIQTGSARLIGKLGTARSDVGLNGQVQLESELWSAEAAQGSPSIGKGDRVEVVDVKGLHLLVRKI